MFLCSECHELIDNMMVDERMKIISDLAVEIWQERYLPYCAMVNPLWSMRVMQNRRKEGRITSYLRTDYCYMQTTQCNVRTTWCNMQEQQAITWREHSVTYRQHAYDTENVSSFIFSYSLGSRTKGMRWFKNGRGWGNLKETVKYMIIRKMKKCLDHWKVIGHSRKMWERFQSRRKKIVECPCQVYCFD